jgi:LysR family hca operon transcriptional activator
VHRENFYSTLLRVLIPLHAQNMLTPNVVARALDGVPPTIDLALGYNNANTNPLLLRLLSRADELVANVQDRSIIRYAVQVMGARSLPPHVVR